MRNGWIGVFLLLLALSAQAQDYEHYKTELESYKQKLESEIVKLVDLSVEQEKLEAKWVKLLEEAGKKPPSYKEIEEIVSKMPTEVPTPRGPRVPVDAELTTAQRSELDQLTQTIRKLEAAFTKLDKKTKHIKWLRQQLAELEGP